jgi:hypothetical protein
MWKMDICGRKLEGLQHPQRRKLTEDLSLAKHNTSGF